MHSTGERFGLRRWEEISLPFPSLPFLHCSLFRGIVRIGSSTVFRLVALLDKKFAQDAKWICRSVERVSISFPSYHKEE